MSPKRYARLQRFRRLVAQVHRDRTVDWAGVAVDRGFHDQPHLVHEFRAFAGLTPTARLATCGPPAGLVPTVCCRKLPAAPVPPPMGDTAPHPRTPTPNN